MSFETLIESSSIKRAIEEMGFENPTEIQEKSIRLIREGMDVIGQSQTGTGKTAAFSIPALEKIKPEIRQTQVLILCPTRELSVQVAGEISKLAKFMQGIKVVPVYGGEPIYKQISALKQGAHVIVGTPGRLIDHINRKTIRFNELHTVILDEADEMLKMGFREDIELIMSAVDGKPQTIMFSATMPRAIIDISNKYLKNPQNIRIQSKGITTSTVIQQYVAVKSKFKLDALYRMLDAKAPERCIVFCNTKRMVDEITDALQGKGFWSDKIHGDLKQELRLAVLHKFNGGVINVLVATDVAARGLDIQNVDLIVNYDIPEKEDYYVHRIGRSGRAGKAGESITIATGRDRNKLRAIEYYIKKKIDRINVPSIQEVNEKKMEHFIDHLMETMNQDVLDHYEPIIHKIEAKGYSVELLAATLLKDALTLHEIVEDHDLNDLHFGSSERSRTPRERSSRSDSRDRGASRDRGTSSDKVNRESKYDKGDRPKRTRDDKANIRRDKGIKNGAASRQGQTRLFLSVGKKHDATVGDLLGAITGESGIDGRSIGAIDMYEKFTFVDVDEQHVDKVIKKMMNKRVKGRKVNIEIAKG